MAGRYAKLENSWLLRGWQDMPKVIFNWKNGLLRQLGQDIFYVAQSCDGLTDFNSPAFLPGHIKLLEKLISEGIATECRQGDKLEKSQEYRKADNPLIHGIHWALTGRCNMNCRHCFMESPSGRYGHPDLDTIKEFLQQFEQANVLQVSLTGGEPLLHKDLPEIIKELTAKKIRLTEIATNGTLISSQLLEMIKNLDQAPDFKISFDGVGVHDLMRGTKGTEEKVKKAIGLVAASGLTVAVSTTLDKDNIKALPQTYELMKELQVPVWLIGRPQTTGNWCGGPAALFTEEMAVACENILRCWLKDEQPFYILLERFFQGGPGILEQKHLNEPSQSSQAGLHGADRYHSQVSFTPESYECDAVRKKPYLLPDGRLLPCVGFTATTVHEQMPNLLERGLSKVWRDSSLRNLVNMKKNEVLSANSECAACSMFAACGAGCRAYALTESGYLLDKDPIACALWQGGFRERFAAITRTVRNITGHTRQLKAERRKEYKARDPLTTINHIRSLLSACDLFTIEYHRNYTVPGVHCCRIILGDSDVSNFGIGSNGKGLTARYALASAYGEIMERLQNNILFPLRQLKFATKKHLTSLPATSEFRKRLEKEELSLDYHYGPDEIYCDSETLVENCSDVLAAMLGIDEPGRQKDYLQKAFKEEEVACLPYYSVTQSKVRYLPIKLIWNMCGTNGMCAGNTPEEALNQGISEVMERYVIRSIYLKNITPPSIPPYYFQNSTILNHIQRLEQAGMSVVIKDCSLGLGLPVIGLLLINDEKNKYTFHVGADPCPITALERCLTEIYQGNPEDVEARFHPFLETNQDVFNIDWQEAYYQTTSGGLGQWPDSLFAVTPSYAFNGFTHPVSESDSTDLDYLLDVVKELGYNLFIRDVSFLGFPSYQVFIPGMSETDFIFDGEDFPNWMAIVRNHASLLNLQNIGTEQIARLTEAISGTEGLSLPVTFEPGRWFVSNVHPELRNLHKDYLLTLLYSRIDDFSAAAESMNRFLQSRIACAGPMLYYRTVHSYLEAKRDGLSDSRIQQILTECYGEIMTAKVKENFYQSEQVLKQVSLPSCFNCNTCEIEKSCRYFDILRRVKTLQKVQQENMPRQSELAEIFVRGQPN